MKRLYTAFAAVIATVMIPFFASAETPLLAISGNGSEVKLDVTDSMVIKSADEILPGIKNCKTEKSQRFSVKSEKDAELSLRLIADGNAWADGKSPLGNYDIKVTDGAENEIYNGSGIVKNGESYADIPLGTVMSDTEYIYSVTYVLKDTSVDTSGVSVSFAVTSALKPTPTPYVSKSKSTPKPKFDFDVLENTDEFVFDFTDLGGTLDKDEKNTDGTQTVKTITKVCGDDIPPGRFSVTGNGKLRILSSAGGVKNEYVISENPSSSAETKTVVTVLESGDVLSITPLDGTEKASLKFNKVKGESSENTVSPKSPGQDSKSNPKTGDDNIGVVVGIMFSAGIALVLLQTLKRKIGNEK